jgi:hypothetical protein
MKVAIFRGKGLEYNHESSDVQGDGLGYNHESSTVMFRGTGLELRIQS